MDIDLSLQAQRDRGKTAIEIEAEIVATIEEDAAKWRRVYDTLMPESLRDCLRDAYEHGAQSAPQRECDQE